MYVCVYVSEVYTSFARVSIRRIALYSLGSCYMQNTHIRAVVRKEKGVANNKAQRRSEGVSWGEKKI